VSDRRIAIITGTRAEYGLLRPVIRACESHDELETHVIITGAHLLGPSHTHREVDAECANVRTVPMQREGESGRLDDARALGRGIEGIADALEDISPEFVVVLGDRIEALAGACAASVGGVLCAHLHGGDRAEGVADEAMRHAITKLAHLHLPATETSAQRIIKMGENDWRVRTVGSPALDGLDEIPVANDTDLRMIAEFDAGVLDAIFLLHPTGRSDETEHTLAANALAALRGLRVLCLSPNHDPGRTGIVRAIDDACARESTFARADHLTRGLFVGILKKLAQDGGALIGNSSAGLIEATSLNLGVLNLGDRQSGRERCANVFQTDGQSIDGIRAGLPCIPRTLIDRKSVV